MDGKIIYINGKFVPENEAKISIFDLGFKYGAVFYESMRTFNHKIFKLEERLSRLENSLKYVGLENLINMEEIKKIIDKVLEKNLKFVEREDDLFLVVEITPGIGPTHPLMPQREFSPTVIVYTSKIPYSEFAKYYLIGKPAFIVKTCNIPPECFNPQIKCRSRLHFYLAKKEVEKYDPDALALLPDLDGNITESTGANFFIVKDGVLFTPSLKNIVKGITRQTVIEIAEKLGIKVIEKDIKEDEILKADEAFFTATTFCILPISKVNGIKIGEKIPGPYTQKIISEWNELVGIDIVKQAIKYAKISAPGQI